MARKLTPSSTREPALLAKPREDVRAQLLARVAAGEALVNQSAITPDDFNALKAAYYSWDEFNEEYLRRAFTNEEYGNTYRNSFAIASMSISRVAVSEEVRQLKDRISSKVRRIASLIERLDLIDEAPGVEVRSVAAVVSRQQPSCDNTKVFLVHGQDEEAKAVVARFISGCGLEPIILHEQPNGGRTIIEKFEREADVGFAIILMTPDDVGGSREGDTLTSKQLRARARQNVVLELGYFAGRLGRERVAALKKGDIEMPSDIAGVVWTPMDASDAWKMSLARELKNAGYEFDIAKALGI